MKGVITTKEIWRDVAGYEGYYQVSNFGRVLSMVSGSPRIMNCSKSSSGYYHLQLYKGGKSKTFLIHSLVACTFIPNPEGKPEINHIDGDKSNNRVDNLEWVTISENQRHAIKMGLRPISPGLGKLGKKNALSKPVFQFDLQGKLIKEWPSSYDASVELNCNQNSIRSCACGFTKTYKGYIWRYSDG